ncbi:MAG: aminotransferase class IV [Actinomycetota bacterium]
MSDSEAVVWRDGELIPFADATVHVLSHAAHRGTEVFDVLRVVATGSGPVALGLREHVARFDRSMQLMGMTSPYSVAAIEEAVAKTVAANPGADVVKLVAAWTEIALSTEPVSLVPSVVVTARPGIPTDILQPVARVASSEMPKMPAEILPPSLKVAAAYTPGVRRQLDLADDVDDVLFRTLDGRLAEATTQSMLVVAGDRLLAPSLDRVLDGITRRLLTELAPDVGLAVEVRDVHWDEVQGADELILTSTNNVIRPVSALDDVSYAAPGPMATALAGQVEALFAGEHALSGRWLTPL